MHAVFQTYTFYIGHSLYGAVCVGLPPWRRQISFANARRSVDRIFKPPDVFRFHYSLQDVLALLPKEMQAHQRHVAAVQVWSTTFCNIRA